MTFHERAVGSPVASEPGLGALKDLEHEFARAFPSAALHGAKLDDTLRHAIRRFVDESKARGATADDVLTTMKDIARRVGFARPDAARPLASLPTDRLFTKVIMVCIEAYHDAAEPSSVLVRRVDSDQDHPTDSKGPRPLYSSSKDEEFTRAMALYVRSAHTRGSSFEQVLAGVTRILNAPDDTRRTTDDVALRWRGLLVRGLLLAVYGEDIGDAPVFHATHPADVSPPSSVNTSPVM
jgi:hypothetical protein